MEGYRMQMLCMLTILLVMLVYFSAKRTRTQEHVIYKIMLWVSLFYTILDVITVYCVNHLETVPMCITDISHRLFYLCICFFMFLLYAYIARLVAIDFSKHKIPRVLLWIPVIVSMAIPMFADIVYVESPRGNYSQGPAVLSVFISASTYMIVSLVIFMMHIKKISMRKRTIITMAWCVEIGVSIYQAMVPSMLLTGVGITIIILAIFVTTENPDRLLMELYVLEKEKAQRASETKTEFLANMSHEIRTPINTILGMDEVILREYDEPQLVEYASSIRDAGFTLLTLVNDILDLSKIEMGRIQLVDAEYSLGALLSEVYQMNNVKAKQKQLEYRFEVDEKLPQKICGDDVRIKQIMNNLISNAIKYTTEGSVVVTIGQEMDNDIWFLTFSVKDTGAGIRKEDMEKVFMTFERLELEKNRRIEGAGLGLSISKKMASMMNGKLWLESEYGVGSTFYFRVPQKVTDVSPLGNFDQQRKVFQRVYEKYAVFFEAPEARILAVDDNEMNLKVVEYLLKASLIQLVCVSSGEAAIERIKESHFDLILLDYMMPGLDGLETLKEIRRLGYNIPVIVLTANAVFGAKERYLSEGFCDYISKPIEISKLEKTLCRHLPQELIHYKNKSELGAQEMSMDAPQESWTLPPIAEINYEQAAEYSTSEDAYIRVLSDFLLFLPDKMDLIVECTDHIYQAKDLRSYTIEIHSMKSTLRLIGAQRLSDMAAELEKAGNAGDLEKILQDTPVIMKELKTLQQNIVNVLNEIQTEDKEELDVLSLMEMLLEMSEAMEQYDTQKSDDIAEELKKYAYTEELEGKVQEIIKMSTNLDYEEAIEFINKMQKDYSNEETS